MSDDKKINFEDHLAENVNKANKLVGIIRTLVALHETMFKNLYTALVRPHLEYTNQVWSHKVKRHQLLKMYRGESQI